jgi:hypothetical protein
MSKFPRLEMMRAQRQRREDELTAPYQAELRTASSMISQLRQTLRAMEEFMGKEIAKHVLEMISDRISEALRREIYKAVSEATGPSKPVKMTFPADVLRFMDPSSMERQVLRQYAERNLPNLSVNLSADITDQYVTTVDIRIPPLGVRQVVTH